MGYTSSFERSLRARYREQNCNCAKPRPAKKRKQVNGQWIQPCLTCRRHIVG